MSTALPLDEQALSAIVEEVLRGLGRSPAGGTAPAPAPAPRPAPAPAAPAAPAPGPRPSAPKGGRFGIFQDIGEACNAAQGAFEQLREKGLEGRGKVVEIVKGLCTAKAEAWGKFEFEETKIGRLADKVAKLQIVKLVPGVEWIKPYGLSGDHGITMEECTPFGVVGAVLPVTHSIPTLSGNVVNIVAAGNSVVFNPHPGGARSAALAVRTFNEAIHAALGIEHLICTVEKPTLESFGALTKHELVRLLCVTGGPAVVQAAMRCGKRAICAGPGNPPVLVDGTRCLDKSARDILSGGAFDNNLLCIGEKEVFALDSIADKLMAEMENNGAARLNAAQLERLTKAAFVFKEGQGAGCPEPVINKDFIGKDPSVLAQAAGVNVTGQTQLLFAETDARHPFVVEEQMMPFLPIVRVKSVEEGIAAAVEAEHNYKHTSIIHSHDVEHMTAMARALDTTLFIKNGWCLAGLGAGGEGYPSYSIATPTGEGVTNPRTFTRVRRCVMVDNLRIY